jgi:hypothetical protein
MWRNFMKLCFGDIVVVDKVEIGVVVKSWVGDRGINHEVYVRSYDKIIEYNESKIERYMVRHKYLNEEEIEYQKNAISGR